MDQRKELLKLARKLRRIAIRNRSDYGHFSTLCDEIQGEIEALLSKLGVTY